MIHYHGTPITPDSAAARILAGRHGLVSFAHPGPIGLVAEVCQSFCLDNGAFSLWKKRPQPISTSPTVAAVRMAIDEVVKWPPYYKWVGEWMYHPGFDFALVPDVIDGSEEENDELLAEWPHGNFVGCPVWHMHESLDRLVRLSAEWPRVALGSSGEYAKVGNKEWWARMGDVMSVVCNDVGQPLVKLHGLRMLNWRVFTRLPLNSADSTNIGRNIGIDKAWRGTYIPVNKTAKGIVLADTIESHNSASFWNNGVATEQFVCEDEESECATQ